MYQYIYIKYLWDFCGFIWIVSFCAAIVTLAKPIEKPEPNIIRGQSSIISVKDEKSWKCQSQDDIDYLKKIPHFGIYIFATFPILYFLNFTIFPLLQFLYQLHFLLSFWGRCVLLCYLILSCWDQSFGIIISIYLIKGLEYFTLFDKGIQLFPLLLQGENCFHLFDKCNSLCHNWRV